MSENIYIGFIFKQNNSFWYHLDFDLVEMIHQKNPIPQYFQF